MKELGTYVVADPRICHGQRTFRGTRILVATVLEQVEQDLSWGDIVTEWHGRVSREAIAEAIHVVGRA